MFANSISYFTYIPAYKRKRKRKRVKLFNRDKYISRYTFIGIITKYCFSCSNMNECTSF